MPDSASDLLRPMAASDADAVQRLWRRRFGGDAATQTNWIEAALAPNHSATGTVAAPPTADRVVAFGLLEIGDPAYTRRYLSLDAVGLDPSLASQNGIFHMYCVHPDWEGHGLGSALYTRHLRQLIDQEVPRAFGISWHRSHTIDSRALFEKHGFTCRATIERYYDRFEERPHCPDCEEACTCTASLYARRISLG